MSAQKRYMDRYKRLRVLKFLCRIGEDGPYSKLLNDEIDAPLSDQYIANVLGQRFVDYSRTPSPPTPLPQGFEV
jgi:hypothetical protein